MIWLKKGRRYLVTTPQFFYAGEFEGESLGAITLVNAVRVYDTGPTYAKHWNEAEYVGEWNIPESQITGWGPSEKTIKPDETRQDGKESSLCLDRSGI